MEWSDFLRGRVNLNLKTRMVRSFIWSVTLCRTESWTNGKEEMEKFEAFEMSLWRRLPRIS